MPPVLLQGYAKPPNDFCGRCCGRLLVFATARKGVFVLVCVGREADSEAHKAGYPGCGNAWPATTEDAYRLSRHTPRSHNPADSAAARSAAVSNPANGLPVVPEAYRGPLTAAQSLAVGNADCHPGQPAFAVGRHGRAECRTCFLGA